MSTPRGQNDTSESVFRALTEHSFDGIAVLGRDAGIRYVNPPGARTMGYEPEELFGRSALDFVHEDDLIRARDSLTALLESAGSTTTISLRIRHSGGSWKWTEAKVTNLLDVPAIGGLLLNFSDVTDRIEAQRALETREQRFRALVENSWDAICLVDRSPRFLYFTPAIRRILGYAPEELLHRDAFSGVHPEDIDGIRSGFEQFLERQGRTVTAQYRHRHKDGSWRWLETTGYNLLHEPAVGAVVLNFRDITERKHREETERFLARASQMIGSSIQGEELLPKLAELAVPFLGDFVAIYITDPSDAFLNGLGLAHRDPARRPLLEELRRQPIDPDGPHIIARVLRTGEPVIVHAVPEGHLEDVSPNDAYLRILRELDPRSAIAVPLIAHGEVLGTVSVVRTGSSHHYTGEELPVVQEFARRVAIAVDNDRMFREMQATQERAEAANRAKDEFLSVLSHELRSPLTAVLTWTHLLKGGTLDEEGRQEAVDAIEKCGRLQARLVEDLLDLSRITLGKLRFDVRELELGSILHQSIELARGAAREKQIELVEAVETGPFPVEGDPARLQQIIGNLLSNAIKFTPTGGQVAVRLSRDEAAVRIQVIDTGIGIAPELLPRIFDRFEQANSSISRRHPGLGIGLTIARHLVELHGGRIDAASDGEDRGATFSVRLPLATSASIATTDGDAAEPPPDEHHRNGISVLVVDDDQANLASTCAMLREEGMQVRSAVSCGAAMAELEGGHVPEVLVTDLAMPDEDGYSVLRQIRDREAALGRRIPVIALTALAGDTEGRRIREAGFDGQVTKPYDPVRLISMVRTLAGSAEDDRKRT